MYWLLTYDLVDDYVARREPLREAHLSLAGSYQRRGFLMLAGALADPVDQAILVFKADDIEVVHGFLNEDPYVREGLVTAWRVRPWTVVVGDSGGLGFGQSRSGVW